MHLRFPSVPLAAARVAPPFCHSHSTAARPNHSQDVTTRPTPRPPPAHQLEACEEALSPEVADAKQRVRARLRRVREEQGGTRGSPQYGADSWLRSSEGRAGAWLAGGGASDPAPSSKKRTIWNKESAEEILSASEEECWTSHNSDSTLPSTEPALFALLLSLSRRHSPPRAEWMAYFHARSEFADLVSPRTYALLLQHTYDRSSNLRLFNELLDEMGERGMWSVEGWEAAGGLPGAQGEWAARIMLKAALREGDRQKVSDVLLKMKARGWGGTPTINEVRNLGSVGKGHGDERYKWKGKGKGQPWKAEAVQRGEDSQPGWIRPRAPSITRYSPFTIQDSTSTFHELDHLLRRQPPYAPKHPTRLKAEDAAALVESFMIEGQAPEAFRIAQSWLNAARHRIAAPRTWTLPRALSDPSQPKSPSSTIFPRHAALPTSSLTDSFALGDNKFARIAYHKTALVFLNILLKSLFSERASPGLIRQFLTEFAEKNGPPPAQDKSTIALTPGLTTLRTLLSGLEGRQGGFQKGTAMIRWFAIRWALPRVEWELLAVDGEAGETRLQFDDQGLSEDRLPPHFYLEGTAALLLLRLATADYRRWDDKLSANRLLFATTIREWWATLDKSSGNVGDVWGTREAKVVESAAVECGLLDPKIDGRLRVLRPVLQTREQNRRKDVARLKAEIDRVKERRRPGIGRGEQKVAPWLE